MKSAGGRSVEVDRGGCHSNRQRTVVLPDDRYGSGFLGPTRRVDLTLHSNIPCKIGSNRGRLRHVRFVGGLCEGCLACGMADGAAYGAAWVTACDIALDITKDIAYGPAGSMLGKRKRSRGTAGVDTRRQLSSM